MADFEGGSGTEGGFFVSDSTPEPFGFTAVTDATTLTVYTADAQLTGVESGAYLVCTNGLLSVDGGVTWAAGPLNYVSGLSYVRATLTSSAAYETESSVVVSVNGVSATFRVTTGAAAVYTPADLSSDEYYHYIEGRMRTFLASAPPVQRSIQVIEISHSGMSENHYLWREPYSGSVTLDDESIVSVRPVNMEIQLAGNETHLDQSFDVMIDTTDADDELRLALDSIPLDTTERVQMVYREYLSDDLTTPQITVSLQVENIVYRKGVAKLTAVTPRLNITRTGEIYSYRRFEMLRGFL